MPGFQIDAPNLIMDGWESRDLFILRHFDAILNQE